MTDKHSPIDVETGLARALVCLEAYGADRARWPAEMHPVFDEASTNAQFKTFLHEARLLDEALASTPTPQGGEKLRASIMKSFAPPVERAGIASMFGARWTRGFGRLIPAGALASLSALGFIAGAASADVAMAPASDEYAYYADAATAVVFSEDDAFWGEIE